MLANVALSALSVSGGSQEVIATRRQDPALASRKDLLSLFMTIKSDEQYVARLNREFVQPLPPRE